MSGPTAPHAGCRLRVTSPYRSEFDAPLRAAAGERFRYQRRPTPYAGWLFCTHESGKSGWVPEVWVTIEGDECVLRRNYDATELTVAGGDLLRCELVEAEWALCLTADGERGWVPLEHVEVVGEGP
jgi:hypothetical protein